jgi:leukotriene-A4 hydrolase
MADTTVDTATQSNPFDVATDHVAFDWTVDFEKEVLKGNAIHSLKIKKDGVTEVMSVRPPSL